MTDTTDIAALRKRLQSAISQHEMMMDCVMGLGKVDPMYQQCIDALDQLEAERQRADDIRASFDELAGIVGFSKERCDQTGASPMDCARELRQRADGLQSTVGRLAQESNKLFDDRQRINKSWTEAETNNALLRDEIAALKGEQVPVALIDERQGSGGFCLTQYGRGLNLQHGTELFTAPQKPTTEQLIEWLEGMEVSIDVSTGDADHGNRLFGKVTDVSELDGAKNGVILLVQDAEANFTAPQKPVVWLGNIAIHDDLHEVGALVSYDDVVAAIEAAGGIVKDGE